MERNHVCLETAKKLKAAGFPQGDWHTSFYAWEPVGGGGWRLSSYNSISAFYRDTAIAAPNGDEISAQIEGEIKLVREGKTWYAHKPHDGGLGVGSGDSIAESLAQHWLRRQEVEQLRQSNGEPK